MNHFYDDGLSFSCTKCSKCCRFEPGFVYVSECDLTKLALWFNLEKESFIEKYCRWIPYYDGTEVLCLKEKPGFDCIMWNDETGCSVYDAKPLQCETYPFWPHLTRSKTVWDNEKACCPGINSGELHCAAEITKKIKECENNQPVSRKTGLK